jgi:hypothetical protein
MQYPFLKLFCYFSYRIVEESILSLGVDAQVTDSCAALNNRYMWTLNYTFIFALIFFLQVDARRHFHGNVVFSFVDVLFSIC